MLATIALALAAAGCVTEVTEQRWQTVVYASGADLQSINPLLTVHPLAKAVQKHVLLLTLASYDTAFNPVPRLASWSWNPSRTALTFRLRSDVRWHDGPPTRARDVQWTLQAALNPAVAYPRARDLAAIEAVELVDSLTVRLAFDRTQAVFPDVLTDLAILPAHRFAETEPAGLRNAEFNRKPVGNGPFAFVDYRPNQRWVFERAPGFPDDLRRPEFTRFVVVVVDEPATKLAALSSGELDFAGISPAHARFVSDDPRLHTIDYPIQLVYGVVWNMRRSPFDDYRVRLALTLALDRKLIVDAYLYGFGSVADGPVPPQHPWYQPARSIPYDPVRAAVLLDEAGWTTDTDGRRRKESRPLVIELLTVGSGDASLEQMIQAQWGEIGVTARIRRLELASFLARAQSPERDYDALVTGIPGDFSLGYVAALYGSSDAGPLAYAGYSSTDFDAALARARAATDEVQLRDAWLGAQRVLDADHPTTWLYFARGLQGANLRIDNTAVDLRGELARIAEWRLGVDR